MNKNLKFAMLGLSLTASIFAGCKKDDPDPDPVFGDVTFKFDNMVGTQDLSIGSGNYTNAHGDAFNVTTFNYYVTNVKLKHADGTYFTEPNSYHLVKETDAASTTFKLSEVPEGEYTEVQFMLGVDSTRNVSGAQTGALDPANGMFWSWNSGYIMAKVEGTSPQSTQTTDDIIFHVGGFSGANSVLKTIKLPLSTRAKVTADIDPTITLKADVLAWFSSPNVIDFSMMNVIHMPGTEAKSLADNYANMFSVKSVTN
jgi:hypothetical protein